MLKYNPVPARSRVQALFLDYLWIAVYLLVLLILTISFYYLFFRKIPLLTMFQSQMIATLTSVLPIIAIFSWMDSRGGSWGKKKAGLKVIYQRKALSSALIRNSIKFLPWQLGHMGTIIGVYTNFTSFLGHLFTFLSLLLLVILLLMGFFRKDKRHLGDLLAGSQVVMKTSLSEN